MGISKNCPFKDSICAAGHCKICDPNAPGLTREEKVRRLKELSGSQEIHWSDGDRRFFEDAAGELAVRFGLVEAPVVAGGDGEDRPDITLPGDGC